MLDVSPNTMTMAELARLCGVSPATVSAALHGTGRVGKARREMIQRRARETGYRPQLGAQMMRAQRTGRLGLVLPHSPSGSAWPLLRAFVASCDESGVGGHVDFYAEQRNGQVLPNHLVDNLVDGVILAGYVDGELRTALAAQQRWPWVSLDEPAAHCVLAATDDGLFQAVQYLAALGHRRIAYCGGPTHYSSHALALAGFERGVQDFGLAVRPGWVRTDADLHTSEATMDAHVHWAMSVLDGPERPTAIICGGMGTASALIYAALSRGIRIPEDLSLVATGQVSDALRRYPMVSCMELDFAEMATIAIHMLQRLLQGEPGAPQTRRVLPRLTPLASTGPAPGLPTH